MSSLSKDSKGEQKTYTYKDFQENFIKIFKEKDKLKKLGIIFIGNSRIGKSTLSCILASIKMQVGINQIQQTCLQPVDQKYRDAVKHTKKSVTQIPNVYDYYLDNDEYSIVDLPGFLDSSYFREICNLHYIKTILSSFQKVCFMMVIEVHNKEKKLADKQLKMIERFYQMFPDAASNTFIIVNNLNPRFEQSQQEKIYQNLNKQILQSQSLKGQVKQQAKKKKFFIELLKSKNKFLFIKKIDLQVNKNPQNSLKQMHNQLQKFIKSNKKSMQKIQEINYKIKFDQLQSQTKKIKQLLKNMVEESANKINQTILLIKKIFQESIQHINKLEISTLKTKELLKNFMVQNKADRQIQVLQKIRFQLINQIFIKKMLQDKTLILNLSSEDNLFQIYNKISQQFTLSQQVLYQISNKLKKIIFLLNLIYSQCENQLKIILLFLVNKIEQLQFLKTSIQNYELDDLQFKSFIKQVEYDLPLNLKTVDVKAQQKLQKLSLKRLQQLQQNTYKGDAYKKKQKINIFKLYFTLLSKQDLLRRFQIIQFKLYLSQIITIDIQSEKQQHEKIKTFQENIKEIKSISNQKDIKNWKKQNNNKQWQILKLKVYQKFIWYFKLHNKNDQVLKCYQSLNNFHQQTLKFVIDKYPQKTLDQKKLKYEKFQSIQGNFLKLIRFDLALKSFQERSKLFRNQYGQEQVQRYLNAQKAILKHYQNVNNISKDQSNQYKKHLNEYKKKLQKPQIPNLSQEQFEKALQEIFQITSHAKDFQNKNHHFGYSSQRILQNKKSDSKQQKNIQIQPFLKKGGLFSLKQPSIAVQNEPPKTTQNKTKKSFDFNSFGHKSKY